MLINNNIFYLIAVMGLFISSFKLINTYDKSLNVNASDVELEGELREIFLMDQNIASAGHILETPPSNWSPGFDEGYYSNIDQFGSYQPIGEVVLPNNDYFVTRAAEEKNGYIYLLTRDGYLYTYDVSELPSVPSFKTYNTPLSSLQLGNGNGLLRNGDYLYAYGYGGLKVINIQNPASPTVVYSRYDITIYNIFRYNNYLIAPGHNGIAVYSISNPVSPSLVSIYYIGNKYFFSAAVYSNTLYTYEFEYDNPGSWGLRVFNFSNPSNLTEIRFISRNSLGYHLRVVGNKLIECGDNSYVGLWSLDTPSNPEFLTSQLASARVCAVDGNNIVVNGKVFHIGGNTLDPVAAFDPGYTQIDGFPYGSAVTPGFIFLSQSRRILIIKKDINIVSESRLDIGMPYDTNRGCSSPYFGCGGPYHGFYAGVCTDLVLDAYNAGVPFNIQNALYQDHINNPGRYRYGTARNSEDMRRYFNYHQNLLPHDQSYQLGDIAFFDWNEDGITDHVNVISEVDPSGRPQKMVDATGVYSGNPSGLAFEHSWASYYDQHTTGHARLSTLFSFYVDSMTDPLETLRVTLISNSVRLSLSDIKGKSTSESYDENLVASNVETFIPYIPGGNFNDLGDQKVITVFHPLSNSSDYFVRLEGQVDTTYELLIETLEGATITDSQLFTETIEANSYQLAEIALTNPNGIIEFIASPPSPSPIVSAPPSLSLVGLFGTSAELKFDVSEVGGQLPINAVLISITDLTNQIGETIPNNKLTISPNDLFDVGANGSQQIIVQIDLVGLLPGTYQGSIVINTQNAGILMIPFSLEIQFHKINLPVVLKNSSLEKK